MCKQGWKILREESTARPKLEFFYGVTQHLREFTQTHVHLVGDAIQPSHPLLPPSPPDLSQHHIFCNEAALRIRWSKYWSFSFSISPSNEYSGLISYRIDWFDLFAVQGTLKSSLTPQFKSIHSSVLNLLYGPSLTSVPDYWKNRILVYTDLCRKSDATGF